MRLEPHVDESESMWRKIAADASVVLIFMATIATVVSAFLRSC